MISDMRGYTVTCFVHVKSPEEASIRDDNSSQESDIFGIDVGGGSSIDRWRPGRQVSPEVAEIMKITFICMFSSACSSHHIHGQDELW